MYIKNIEYKFYFYKQYYISFISQNRNDLSKLTSYFDEYNPNNIDLYIFFLVIKSLQQTKCIKLIYSYTCIYIYNTRASKYAFQTNFVIHTHHTHLKLSYRILDQIPIWIKSPILTKWSISSSISPNKHKYDDGIKMLIV